VSSAAVLLPAAIEVLVVLLLAGVVGSIRALIRGCAVLRHWRREAPHPYKDVLLKSPLVPGVSVVTVVPHGNPDSMPLVRRLLALEYGEREIVVVLNGASPRAVETWMEDFHLFVSYRVSGEPLATGRVRAVYESKDPIELVVVDKEGGSEADALNAGLNASSTPYIALIDPQSEFQQDALLRLIVPICEAPEKTLAVCGGVPDESSGTLAGRFAEIESLRAWLGRSLAFGGWNTVLPAPGQAVVIERRAIVEAGGWLAGPLEMFLQLHGNARKKGRPHRIAFLPDPVSRPRVVVNLDDLRGHIAREQHWIGSAMRRLRSIPGGWAALGWGMPALLWARLLRPIAETAIYLLTLAALVMGWIGGDLAILVLLATVVGGILVSMSAVVLRELAEYRASDPSKLASLFLATIPENLGYRQLRNLWLIAGMFGREP
jgi:cellulose synthase/poly-beta-1,6-N-acetylglucosamine synthase-like glycosyltransferase